jgi:ribonuclease HI
MKDNQIVKKLYYGMTNTTNNRMELLAVINTLKFFKEKVKIIIYSDSQYVVNSIMKGWVYV